MSGKNRGKNTSAAKKTVDSEDKKATEKTEEKIEEKAVEKAVEKTAEVKTATDELEKNTKTKQNENQKKDDQAKERIQKLLSFYFKYKRYIAAGVLFLAMILILVKCSGPVKQSGTADSRTTATDTVAGSAVAQEFEVDQHPEINELITNYYKEYAEGNVDQLAKFASPISDTEKSYIKVFSKYVDSYNNLKCYTKDGLYDGEYIVSVYIEMKFKGVDTAAPGLDFFYVRTGKDKELYIDNVYSQFNQSNLEVATDADVQALINEFEQAKDVTALQSDVQTKYNAAVAGDKKLKKMVEKTIPNAISAWVKSYTADSATKDTATDTKSDDTTADTTTTTKKTKTMYALDTLKIRAGRSKDKDLIATAKAGTKVTMYTQSEKNGWVKVKYDGDTGYVKKSTLTADKSDVKTTTTSKTTEKTTTDKTSNTKTVYAKTKVNIRKGRSVDHSVVVTVKAGAKLTMYTDTKKDGWVKVAYKGKKGFVKNSYLTNDKSKVEKEEETISIAEGTKITLTDSVNVRKSMSENSDRVILAYKGDVLTVVQSYKEGWTKVKVNGKTGYVKTELLK